MDNELQQKIMNLINGAEQQIPEIAQEYLAWGAMSSCIGIVISLIMLIVGIIFICKTLPLKFEKESECACIILGCLLAVLGTLLLTINSYELIKIKTAPKVYLIDSLRSK